MICVNFREFYFIVVTLDQGILSIFGIFSYFVKNLKLEFYLFLNSKQRSPMVRCCLPWHRKLTQLELRFEDALLV